MGEYATYNGASVKIGTCEDMYYLRATDRHKVRPLQGSVNPNGAEVLALRFRFPWPDEDSAARPGFDDSEHRFDRGVAIHGPRAPEGVEHGRVQFVANAGYLTSLPCPEGPTPPPDIHRNGFSGAVHLCQQKLLADGRLVPVLRCGGCERKWRLEEPADIDALIVAIRAEGDRRKKDGTGDWWHTVADRIAEGARLTPAAA